MAMATTLLGETPVHTVGELPARGSHAPAYTLTGADLADFTSSPRRAPGSCSTSSRASTPVCARRRVRRFNELAAGLDNTAVVCASADLPFALRRFCGAEGIENVTVGVVVPQQLRRPTTA